MGRRWMVWVFLWGAPFGAWLGGATDTSVKVGADLQAAIEATPSGATLRLEAGVHQGPITIDSPLRLVGAPGAIVDGRRRGSVIRIRAADTRIERLTIRNSGLDLGADNAGIHSVGANTRIVGNEIVSCLHGVYLREVTGGRVTGNRIVGAIGRALPPVFDVLSRGAPTADGAEICAVGRLDENRRGNGIHLFSSSEITIADNQIARTRDGMYFSFSERCQVIGNEVRATRYGLHYMYSDDNRFAGNNFTENAAGAAVMYSARLEVVNNRFEGNRGKRAYGALLQSVDDSQFARNRFGENTIGLYAENCQNNRFLDNIIAESYLGFRMGGSCRGNLLMGNQFLHNLHAVESTGDAAANQWNGDERGNWWGGASQSPDLDGDGIGELPHRESNLMSGLRSRFPIAGLLSGSPGLEALRFAHSRGTGLGTRTVRDAHPLVRPNQR